jgi:hypothetical protein
MNRDDITRMAREAGYGNAMVDLHAPALERFAALIAAPLQERIRLLYEQLGEAEKQLDAQYKLGVEAEREACAKVCDDLWQDDKTAYDCREAIRARGNNA